MSVLPFPKIFELFMEVQRHLLNFLPLTNFPEESFTHSLKKNYNVGAPTQLTSVLLLPREIRFMCLLCTLLDFQET